MLSFGPAAEKRVLRTYTNSEDSDQRQDLRCAPTQYRTLLKVLRIITKTCLFKYTENFIIKKMKKNQIKKSYIFHISAQNTDCGYSLEPPSWGSSNNLCF